MFFFLYPFLALLDLSVFILSWIFINWWVPVFANEDGWLPNWLKWFQTFDASLDSGWKDGYAGFSKPQTKFQLFWQRVKWLYRNTAYGFSYWALGQSFDPKEWTIVKYVSNETVEVFYAKGPNGQFNYMYHGKWGRYKLGWKAWNYWDSDKNVWKTTPWGPEWRVPFVFSPNPIQRKS